MIISEEEYLAHYGILRRSGRYPWGSGENPYQRNKMFLDIVGDMKREGMSDAEIAKGFGITSTELRAAKSIARNANKQADINYAQRLKDRGLSNVAIGKKMGLNESSVRSLLAPGASEKVTILNATSDMLKQQVADKEFIDVGVGVERALPGAPGTDQLIGISRTKLDTAIAKLREEGYKIHYVKVQQLGTGQQTTIKVLTKPDVPYSEVYKNRHKIRQITEHSDDGGRTWFGIQPPKSIDSKRVAINYAEDGGKEADGVIFVRPGVEDVSLGGSNYAQVRIAVDDTHFLKGMAMYKADMPPGVDLVFNTNKTRAEAPTKHDAMKPLKRDKQGNVDQDNPFGAVIKPGGQRGVMNVLNEEGDWKTWAKNLSTQMLSKQNTLLAKNQLSMTYENKQQELDEILSLTNPVVRKKLLESFADGADASAVHLKAAALPGQASHVLLPVNSMKPTEIYAPNYKDGERVVLIRFPHGGIFEIPELTVNNRHREAKALIGTQAKDAVGINSQVAERLSGADFDGDTVLVIPNNLGKVKTAAALEGLKNFDAKTAFPAYEGMKPMTPRAKQQQMGDVSNLITDMTIRGASASELARAVRHSMVVIDAEKHTLDYKGSAEANGIAQLKEKYQGGKRAGASTLISLATSETRLPERKPRPAKDGGPIDKKTGAKVFVETGETYINKKGKLVTKTFKAEKLAVTDDANTLSSGTPIEQIYADHSNRLKRLANQARKEMVNTKNLPYSPSAKAAYSNEVASLNSKLNIALMNAPRERQAQVLANAIVAEKKRASPNMEPDELKKIKGQVLAEARTRTGANKERIQITPSEWDAIQAGAISTNKLEQILSNTDLDVVKQYATPRAAPKISSSHLALAKSMANAGFTQAEIAERLGVSASTVTNILSEGG